MARASRKKRQVQLTVNVDDCRIRVQTGEPIAFVDARWPCDHTASAEQIAGSLRVDPETFPLCLPCHKHNYLVVYCA